MGLHSFAVLLHVSQRCGRNIFQSHPWFQEKETCLEQHEPHLQLEAVPRLDPLSLSGTVDSRHVRRD